MHCRGASTTDLDRPGVRLLAVLDRVVRQGGQISGLSGSIAVCVSGLWWHARFDRAVTTQFQSEVPAADAKLELGMLEAETLLEEGRLPIAHSLIRFEGDRVLFQRFIRRYLSKSNAVTVRARSKDWWTRYPAVLRRR
jgi:hypothetical protein